MKTAYAAARTWRVGVADTMFLSLEDNGQMSMFYLRSSCCDLIPLWRNHDGTVTPYMQCPGCSQRVWEHLNVEDASYAHYCPVRSPLLQTWCECAFGPLAAEIIASELQELAHYLLRDPARHVVMAKPVWATNFTVTLEQAEA